MYDKQQQKMKKKNTRGKNGVFFRADSEWIALNAIGEWVNEIEWIKVYAHTHTIQTGAFKKMHI